MALLLSKQVAAMLADCSASTLDRAIAAGHIEVKRFGNRVAIDRVHLDAWIASRTVPIADAKQIFAERRA